MEGRPWLKPGDRVRVEIDGIGAIENEVVQERIAVERALAASRGPSCVNRPRTPRSTPTCSIVGYGPVGQTAAALLACPRPPGGGLRALRGSCTTCRAPSTSTTRSCRSGRRSASPARSTSSPPGRYQWFGADGEPILRMEHPPVGPSGWEPGYTFYQPSLERALDRAVRALPTVEVHRGWSAEALEQARRPRRGDAAPRPRAASRARVEPTAETTHGARPLRDRRRRRELVRARRGGHRLRRPGLRRALARRRPAAATTSRRCPPSPRTCQWCDPARPHMHTRNGRPPPPLRVHAAARRAAGGLRRRGPRVGAARAVVRAGRRRARAPCGLRVPRPPGGHHARRPRAAGRRRRAHHAAVHGPGSVLRRPRRREPGVAAGPRPARRSPATGCSTPTRPSGSRRRVDRERSRPRWGACRARSTPRPPPSATRPCAPPKRRRRWRCRRSATACSCRGMPLAGTRAVQGARPPRRARGPLRRRRRQAASSCSRGAPRTSRPTTPSSWSASAPAPSRSTSSTTSTAG